MSDQKNISNLPPDDLYRRYLMAQAAGGGFNPASNPEELGLEKDRIGQQDAKKMQKKFQIRRKKLKNKLKKLEILRELQMKEELVSR